MADSPLTEPQATPSDSPGLSLSADAIADEMPSMLARMASLDSVNDTVPGSVLLQDINDQSEYIVNTLEVPAGADDTAHGARIQPERKATIYTLADALSLTPWQISTRLKMDIRTVKAVLAHREADAMAARNLLDASSLDAARSWTLACMTGAAKGRHEPARDLLLHRKVIEPLKTEAPQNNVTVVLNGGPAPRELRQLSPPLDVTSERKSSDSGA